MKNSPSFTAQLEKADLKKTAFRRELLHVFAETNRPITAAQIYDILLKNKKLKAYRFDRATLFRNLKILVEKSILNATEFGTGAAYYCLNSDRHHHHHIFCMRCESVKALDVCAVGPMIDQAKRLGYTVLNHRLELIGLCPACSA